MQNRDAIMGGTWDPPPADLPMDLVIDEDELGSGQEEAPPATAYTVRFSL